MEINFDLLENEIFHLLGDKSILVLATSYENRVTARSMCCIVINKKIYFQTDKTFLKYEQIINNPNVALCVDSIQIEGVAKVQAHPFHEENEGFINVFKEKHRGSYENYSHMKNEVVVEVKPSLITLWKYENGQPFREILDVNDNKAYKENYDTSI